MAAVEPVSAASAQAQVQVQVHARAQRRDDPALGIGAGPALRRLTVGSQLTGPVVAAADGRLQVAVERGLLTLEGARPLPPGTRVVVQITAVQPTLQGTLRLVAASPASTSTAASPDVRVAAPAAGGGGNAGPPGLATLLTPMFWDEPAADIGQPVVRPEGALLETGTRLPVRIIASGPSSGAAGLPGDPPAGFAERLAPGVRLAGVVDQTLPDGRVVARVGSGTLLLPPVPGLIPGETIALVVAGQPLEGAAQPAAGVAPLSAATVLRGERWPALDAALALPPETSAAIRAALPQADGTLARHLQAMAAAVRMRDPRVWPGAPVCADLARRRPDLLAALTCDLGEIAPRAEGSAGEEWVVFGLPLLVGAEVAPVRLLFRDGAGDRPGERRGCDRRVLVDLTLSRLGRVQIDMLIHGSLAMLDVVVRSEQPFPPAVRDDIRALVRDAVGGIDAIGSIEFQSAPSRFVEVTTPHRDRPDGVVVV